MCYIISALLFCTYCETFVMFSKHKRSKHKKSVIYLSKVVLLQSHSIEFLLGYSNNDFQFLTNATYLKPLLAS